MSGHLLATLKIILRSVMVELVDQSGTEREGTKETRRGVTVRLHLQLIRLPGAELHTVGVKHDLKDSHPR